MTLQHSLEEEPQLFLVPAFVVDSVVHVIADVAKHGRDDAVVRPQMLREREGPAGRLAVALQHVIERGELAAEDFVREAWPEEDRYRVRRSIALAVNGALAQLVQDQVPVLVHCDGAAIDREVLHAGPDGAYRQRLPAARLLSQR